MGREYEFPHQFLPTPPSKEDVVKKENMTKTGTITNTILFHAGIL